MNNPVKKPIYNRCVNVIQHPDGSTTKIFADGTVRRCSTDGHELILFANGMQRTIIPNGIVVDNYPDGSAAAFGPNGATVTIACDGTSYYYERGDSVGVSLKQNVPVLLPPNVVSIIK